MRDATVRTAVRPGRVRPSGPNLCALIAFSYWQEVVSIGEVPSDERCCPEYQYGEAGQPLEVRLGYEVAVLDAVDRVPVGREIGRHDGAGQSHPTAPAPKQEPRRKWVEGGGHGEAGR